MTNPSCGPSSAADFRLGEQVVKAAQPGRIAAGLLEPGEWVRARAGLGRAAYGPAIAIGLLWGVVGLWALVAGLGMLALLAGAILLAAVPGLLLWALRRRRTSMVLLTDRRLIAVAGPWPRRVEAMPLPVLDRLHVRRARLRWPGSRTASLVVVPLGDTELQPFMVHDVAQADSFARQVLAVTGSPGGDMWGPETGSGGNPC